MGRTYWMPSHSWPCYTDVQAFRILVFFRFYELELTSVPFMNRSSFPYGQLQRASVTSMTDAEHVLTPWVFVRPTESGLTITFALWFMLIVWSAWLGAARCWLCSERFSYRHVHDLRCWPMILFACTCIYFGG